MGTLLRNSRRLIDIFARDFVRDTFSDTLHRSSIYLRKHKFLADAKLYFAVNKAFKRI